MLPGRQKIRASIYICAYVHMCVQLFTRSHVQLLSDSYILTAVSFESLAVDYLNTLIYIFTNNFKCRFNN